MTNENETEVNQELLVLQNAWSKTEAAKIPPPLPDGDYVGKLVEMRLGKSRKNNLQVVSLYKVMDGNYIGKEIVKYDGIVQESNISFFKAYCDVIGFEYPSDITKLEEALKEFTGSFNSLVNLSVKTNGEFTNIYVKGLVEYDAH